MSIGKGLLKRTVVESPSGSKYVEFFNKGDIIYSLDSSSGKLTDKEILDVTFGWADDLMKVIFDGIYTVFPFRQPVNTVRGVIKVEDLEEGDRLIGIRGTGNYTEYEVSYITSANASGPVRYFEIEGDTGVYAEGIHVL